MNAIAPQVENLPVAKLSVDAEVQRSVEKARVDRIAQAFRWDAFGTLVVSARADGTHHIIDGQHRAAAAVAAGLGDSEAPCQVYRGLSRQDEAAMFRLLNDTRRVAPMDKFRVRVVEGDPTAVTLVAILHAHGWRLEASKNPGSFVAVSALEAVFTGKLVGPGSTATICDTLIRVCTEAWGHDAHGVRSEIISGIGAVLLRYNTHVDLPKLIAELGLLKSGPRGLIGKAKGLRDYRGGRLSDALAEIIIELLNKGRRTNRLPQWRSAA